MHRILALVALLATMWPQLVVMRCSSGTMGSDHAEAVSVVAEHSHDAPTCPTFSACSSSMLEGVVVEGIAEPDAPPIVQPRTLIVALSATALSTDPPPPRRIA